MAAIPFVPGTEPVRPEPATLVGEIPTRQPAAPSAAEANRAVMQQIRELTASVEALATQFPETSESARAVKQGLVDMMVRIVASQRTPESPSPQILG